MKTTLIAGVLIAASQCMPEPSDPPASRTATAGSKPDVEALDAGAPDAAEPQPTAAAERRLPKPGPPPFTVPTQRIEWPQQRATLLVPRGTQLDGEDGRATVMLGEGRNFAFHVAPAGQETLPAPSDAATTSDSAPDEDGLRMWYTDGHWFFAGTSGAFDCWNDSDSEHDREEVEMMRASCASIEQEAPK